MTPHQLAAKIRKLRERAPITASFERVLTQRAIWSKSPVSILRKRSIGSAGWIEGVRLRKRLSS
jgi:hypothetical protein